MRVTSEMMVTASLRRLTSRLERYESAQAALSSGRRMRAPSDDPAGASQGLRLRAAIRAREQELRSATEGSGWLAATDGQLAAAVDRLQRVRDLVVRAASSVGAAERGAIAHEVRAVRDELQGIANAEHGGRPLFAGFAGGPAVVNTAGVWAYGGDGGEIARRVSDADRVRVNVTAAEVFGFDVPGGDAFTLLDDVLAALGTGDENVLAASLDGVDAALGRIGGQQAAVGSAANRVESARQRTGDVLLALRGELATVEDIEVAGAIVELQTQQVAYETSLQALARALPPSLVSFLR